MGMAYRINYKGQELLPVKRDLVFKAIFAEHGTSGSARKQQAGTDGYPGKNEGSKTH